jgi:hypothetical protein
MKLKTSTCRSILAGAMALAGSAAATAQTDSANASTSAPSMTVAQAGTGMSSRDSYSLLPYTRRGYIGLNIGRPEYTSSCGVGGFACDDPSASVHLYTGGMFNEYVGLEFGYLNMGKADRGGGDAKAQGLNLSLVGRAPLGPASVFVKAGTTYGRTTVSANPASGLVSGKESGWGGSYGAGVGFDVSNNGTVVLEWTHQDFHFAGTGREAVKATSLGYVYRF